MEPEAKAFLKRVGNSLAIGFVWLAVNVTAAIKGDNAFIEGKIRLGNVLFYLWFVISIWIMIKLYKRLWGQNDVS